MASVTQIRIRVFKKPIGSQKIFQLKFKQESPDMVERVVLVPPENTTQTCNCCRYVMKGADNLIKNGQVRYNGEDEVI